MDKKASISLKKSNSTWRIVLPARFRNKMWGEQFGIVQKELRAMPQECKNLIVDMRHITWIDPLPLLSLLISLAELDNRNISIIIPCIGDNQEQSNRVLAFLHTEGFFQVFERIGIKTLERDKSEAIYDFSTYDSLVEYLNYSNCSIISARIIDLQEIESNNYSIDQMIRDDVNQNQYTIRNKVGGYKAVEVLNRLQRLLSETISNVFEHAYPNSGTKLVGYYVRFRNGLGNSQVVGEARTQLKSLLKNETNESQKLEWYFLQNIVNFIEVFVIDAGSGFSKSYFSEYDQKKYPFRIAWGNAILDGRRGLAGKNKKTQYGGLFSICRMLGNNYICGRDSNDWVGHVLPPQFEKPETQGEMIDASISNIQGFSLIFRMSWEVVTDELGAWAKLASPNGQLGFSAASIAENPYLRELSNPTDAYQRFYGSRYSEIVSQGILQIVDERFPQVSDLLGSKTNKIVEHCIFLPARGLQKNNIQRQVVEIYGDIVCETKTLIIADILVFEAHLFQLALENAKYPPNFIQKYTRIVLVTQRLSVLVLLSNGNSFVSNSQAALKYRNCEDAAFSPDKCLGHLVAWLKSHDSLLFWLYVSKKNDQDEKYYINNYVPWSIGSEIKGINGYLNFSQVLTELPLQRLIENALYRTLSLSDMYSCLYNSIDVLTDRLASKMNSLFFQKHSQISKTPTIMLGSIKVSGLSQQSAEKIANSKNGISIHFFINKSTDQEISTTNESTDQNLHLFLWPTEWLSTTFPKTSIEYERVGRSHVIAPRGWKYYPIPRFFLRNTSTGEIVDPNESISNDLEFVSAYGCTPSETYDAWQLVGKQVLEIGHFHYEGKHDLLKIDFLLTVNENLNHGGKLGVFLLSEFLSSLGATAKDVLEKGPSAGNILWETKLSSKLEDNRHKRFVAEIDAAIKSNSSQKCALVVYPIHFHTEQIVDSLKAFIDSRLHSQIVGLIPISKERNSTAYLISPLILESIRRKISEYKKLYSEAPVLIFDEATIEGRTRKDLKHLLFQLGATEVRSLCVVDRRRLPFGPSNPNRHKAFWRLDVPRLGSRDNCQLCKSIEQVSAFKTLLIFSNDKEKIQFWIDAWSSTFPYSKPDIHGLLSKPLRKTLEKRFSLLLDRRTGEVKHFDTIRLRNSIGLSIYSAEIHAMTGRDDMALELCEREDLSGLIKLEVLAVNLILYGRDFSASVNAQMVQAILREMLILDETSNETALAVLAIASQQEVDLGFLYDSSLNHHKTDVEIKNHDLRLLFCFLTHHRASEFPHTSSIQSLLKSWHTSNTKDYYWSLHHEIYNAFGRIHNAALEKLSPINKYSRFDPNLFKEAIASCDLLGTIIPYFPIFNGRDLVEKEVVNSITHEIQEMQSALRYCLQSQILETKIENFESFLFAKKLAVKLILKLRNFHSNFFIKLGIQDLDHKPSPLWDHLDSLIMLNPNSSIYLEPFQRLKDQFEYERWVPWDKRIVRKVGFILDNVKYHEGYIIPNENGEFKHIRNDEAVPREGIFHSMIVRIEYAMDGIQLAFINYSVISGEEINKRASVKNKPEKDHLRKLGGKLSYETLTFEDNVYLVKTAFFLPFV